MMGSFLSRALLMIFGYAYPAYECYKQVESNEPEIKHLVFWCQYWVLVALFTVFERVGDTFISWLPMYNAAKLILFIYLWHPKTKGTEYVYEAFFRPYVTKHEPEIDRSLSELKGKSAKIATSYWRKGLSLSKIWFSEILLYASTKWHSMPDQFRNSN